MFAIIRQNSDVEPLEGERVLLHPRPRVAEELISEQGEPLLLVVGEIPRREKSISVEALREGVRTATRFVLVDIDAVDELGEHVYVLQKTAEAKFRDEGWKLVEECGVDSASGVIKTYPKSEILFVPVPGKQFGFHVYIRDIKPSAAAESHSG